ncbi:WxL domain-containing protein [Streptomyces bambusae]|uniref:WxL domain-containing protein n=1 Tax=Streptomyces bambusae TaxID=1550616 RepID=UPI001CFD55A8|nr:WxL domain-containing protein [Streptomyces bambusae]MCB5164805.1 WxL domain-containing protein [Streptomyces bambusae]
MEARRGHRWAATLGVVALAASAAPSATASGAAAQDVAFRTHCLAPQESGLAPADGRTRATVTVDNAAPKAGDTVTVTYRVVTTVAGNPLDTPLPADTVTPTGKVRLGGAQQGEVTVVGAKRNDPVPARGAFAAFDMTGTFTVTDPGVITLAPGDYALHTSHLMELDTRCTADRAPVAARLTAAPDPAANRRALALAAPSGPPGAKVRVTGAGFTPGAAVTVAGRAGAAETADRVTATADGLGTLTAELPAADRTTTAVIAYEGPAWTAERGTGPAAYAVIREVPPPPGSQKVTVDVTPGALSMLQEGAEIALSPVPYGEGGAATGRIRTVTVKDLRGGPAGWSLTGRLTDFTGPGGARLDGARLTWRPVCVTRAGSPSTCAAGSPGPLGDGATLASTPDAGLVGGEFTVDAEVSLDVPAYTAPGAYTAVLTLTLS